MATQSKSGNSGNGKRKVSPKVQAKKKRKRIILFVIEIFVLLVMLLVLYGVTKTEQLGKIVVNEEDIVINEGVKDVETLKGYRNIALFGVDATNGALGKGTRTDTVMIASINEDTKEVKLVSVYRDTYLNIGNDSYNKCNAAYAKGGPEQAMTMLNMNLDLNITDYITVGFVGMVDTIDSLGGVEIDVDSAELSHMNNYGLCIAENINRKYTPVKATGFQRLDGMQATGYCRVRYTKGDDFKRAERQREVLMAIAEVAKKAKLSELDATANKVFENVSTSLDLGEILSLLKDIASYEVIDNTGFPFDSDRATGTIAVGSSVIADTLEENVVRLHEFLFNAADYQPSESVKEISSKIKSDVTPYLTGAKKAPKSAQNDDVISKDVPADAPAETPADAPAETPADVPAEAPVE